jgi:DNA-binding NtrC family response regulator
MMILLVDDDDGLRSMVASELELRGCDVRQCSSGDEAFYVWQRSTPWELVLTDFLFFPDARIENGAQLVTAIHGINPLQQMAIMTADPQAARRNLPKALRGLPILRKPFRIEQVLGLLQQPLLSLSVGCGLWV